MSVQNLKCYICKYNVLTILPTYNTNTDGHVSLARNNTNSIYGYRYLSANNICLGIVFVNSGANVDQEAWLPRVSIHLLLYPLTRSFFFCIQFA